MRFETLNTLKQSAMALAGYGLGQEAYHALDTLLGKEDLVLFMNMESGEDSRPTVSISKQTRGIQRGIVVDFPLHGNQYSVFIGPKGRMICLSKSQDGQDLPLPDNLVAEIYTHLQQRKPITLTPSRVAEFRERILGDQPNNSFLVDEGNTSVRVSAKGNRICLSLAHGGIEENVTIECRGDNVITNAMAESQLIGLIKVDERSGSKVALLLTQLERAYFAQMP